MMVRKFNVLISLLLIVTLIFTLSCSIIPLGVKNLFYTKTSTSTATPTATATPTITPTPMVNLVPCGLNENCHQAVLIENYLSSESVGPGVQKAIIPYDQAIHFVSCWVAKDASILEENLQSLDWTFKIDGHDYLISDLLQVDNLINQEGDGIVYPVMCLGVVLEDWKAGEIHEIEIGFVVNKDIFNGWETILDGTSYIESFQIIPAKIPTPTPTLTPTMTPTITPTATITLTPKPVATKTISTSGGSTLNLTIKVVNKCDRTREVVFKGPTTLTFTLTAGQSQEQRAVQGTYKWTLDGFLIFGPLDLYTTAWTLTLCK